MRRIIFLLVFLLLPLAGSAAQVVPSKSPRVLVIGKRGISTNVEAYYVEATNEVKAAAVSSDVVPTVEEIVVAPVKTDPAPVAAVPTPVQPAVNWDPLVSAMEMMIEQQKMSMVVMEKSRTESLLSAREASQAMQDKMESMEKALSAQREHEAESMSRMNRLVIGVAAGFAATGFVVMVFTAWFFMRTMNRLAEFNSNLHTQLLALPQIQQAQLGNGPGVAANPSSQRLIGALEQLEHRIRDLEHTSGDDGLVRPAESVEAEIIPPNTAAASAHRSDGAAKGASPEPDPVDDGPSVSALLSKGQTLMNMDQPGDALNCFNQALKKEPRNAEALLKKGTALERLRRMQEAIDAYDGAIAIDDSMTMAYLAKGGLCNRMERYSEALECYEKALASQQQAA